MGERKERELAEAGLDKALRSIVKEECTKAYLNDEIANGVVSQVAGHIKSVLRAFEVARQYANKGLGKRYTVEVKVDASGVHESGLAHDEAGMGPLPPHWINIFAFLRALKEIVSRPFRKILAKRSLIVLGRQLYRLAPSHSSAVRISRASLQYSGENGWKWTKAMGRLTLDAARSANRHIVIVGSSGYGKSTMLETIAGGICNLGVPIVMFDAHGEHRGMISSLGGRSHDSSISGINILSLDGVSEKTRAREVSYAIARTYSLGYLQRLKLNQCILYTYRKFRGAGKEPAIRDLISEINIFIRRSRSAAEKNRLYQIKDRVEELDYGTFSEDVFSIKEVFSGVNSFDLSRIYGADAKMLYIEELLKRLYSRMPEAKAGSMPRMYIMIDEGRSMIENSGASAEIVNSIMEEGRKFGYAVVLVAHNASELSKQIISNAGTLIAFRSKEPSDLNYIANIVSGGMQNMHEVKGMMAKLGVGQAIVAGGSSGTPTVIGVYRRRYMQEHGEGWQDSLYEKLAVPVLLKDVVGEGDMQISRALYSLLNSGKAEMFDFKLNGANERWVMRKSNQSAEHAVMVKKIAESASSSGLWCRVYNNSKGPDLVVYLGGKKVAIEYETGRKAIEDSVKMIASRNESFARTIVVVNDSHVDGYRNALLDGALVVGASEALLTGIKDLLA